MLGLRKPRSVITPSGDGYRTLKVNLMTMQQEQEFAQALQRTAKEIAKREGCSYAEGLVRIVDVLTNSPVIR
jgi:hypothetical protein